MKCYFFFMMIMHCYREMQRDGDGGKGFNEEFLGACGESVRNVFYKNGISHFPTFYTPALPVDCVKQRQLSLSEDSSLHSSFPHLVAFAGTDHCQRNTSVSRCIFYDSVPPGRDVALPFCILEH